jgi:hypothetical protein
MGAVGSLTAAMRVVDMIEDITRKKATSLTEEEGAGKDEEEEEGGEQGEERAPVRHDRATHPDIADHAVWKAQKQARSAAHQRQEREQQIHRHDHGQRVLANGAKTIGGIPSHEIFRSMEDTEDDFVSCGRAVRE